MTTIGLISDTHGLLRPETVDALAGSDLIIHAGDIGSAEIIEALRQIAPVRAIRGNVDSESWAEQLPSEDTVTFAGRQIYVLHNLADLTLEPRAAGIDVVVSGHSHKPFVRKANGVLFVNPGSAGPRRFTLPVAMAMLHITPRSIRAQLHELVT